MSMQSVLEVLKKSEAYLEKAGLESPKVDAQWLMADTLGVKRLDLFLRWEEPLQEDVLQVLRERIRRRATREPLQYILGYWDFHDIRLSLAPGVLIPRPETEQLVERLVDRLKGMDAPRIVDLGTGSGAIALALAKALPGARVLAVERSPEALAQARANAEALDLRERVAFRSGDWLESLTFTADCIVSNPPYLTEAEWTAAAPEVREHEPKEALVAEKDGIADLERIIRSAPARLDRNGLLALEMGTGHGDALRKLALDTGFPEAVVEKDDSDRDRFLFARSAQ